MFQFTNKQCFAETFLKYDNFKLRLRVLTDCIAMVSYCLPTIVRLCYSLYYMASSVSGQDESDPAL